MKIRIIAGHCLGSGRDCFPGDVLEVDQQLAERKIKNGWAVAAGVDEPVNFVLRPPPVDIPVLEPASGVAATDPPVAAPATPASAKAGGHGRAHEGRT